MGAQLCLTAARLLCAWDFPVKNTFPPPGYLPNPGIEPATLAFPALAGEFFTTEPPYREMKSFAKGKASWNGYKGHLNDKL